MESEGTKRSKVEIIEAALDDQDQMIGSINKEIEETRELTKNINLDVNETDLSQILDCVSSALLKVNSISKRFDQLSEQISVLNNESLKTEEMLEDLRNDINSEASIPH